jgi:hypothetical protein
VGAGLVNQVLQQTPGQALAAQNHYAVLWMHPDETTSQSADWPQ